MSLTCLLRQDGMIDGRRPLKNLAIITEHRGTDTPYIAVPFVLARLSCGRPPHSLFTWRT